MRTQQQQSAYAAACPDCDVDLQTDEPNEIVEFYRRHYRVTGHDVEFARISPDLTEAVTENDLQEVYTLKDIVLQLQKKYDDGVPIGVIAAVMSEQDLSIGETLDELYEVRMDGRLYEPQDDHLCAF